MVTRPPAVAGTFYPADPAALAAEVDRHVDAGRTRLGALRLLPKAIVAPHAGYVYSGPIAGTAYAAIEPCRDAIERVVLLGPAHREWVAGLATSSAGAFATPLGAVPLDRVALHDTLRHPQAAVRDAAHAREHSLEVQLPFLQRVLGAFEPIPFAVGLATDAEVAEVLDDLWGGAETLIVISTDLSHYYDYDTARRLDAATCAAVEALAPERLDRDSACGRIPLAGLLVAARRRGLHARLLDLRNSGDTAGPRDEVVGYAAFALA